MRRSERLSNDHDTCVVSIHHFFVLLACHEAKLERVIDDLISITEVCAMDDFDIAGKELGTEFSTCSEVDQVEDLFLLVKEIVGRIWVTLHHLPFEQLSEAKFEHIGTDLVPHFL